MPPSNPDADAPEPAADLVETADRPTMGTDGDESLGMELPPEPPTPEWPGLSRLADRGGGRAVSAAFGKYHLLEEIGRGGMGVVFKARQRDLDRFVAIKMILSNHLASPEQVARFYSEAKAAARLRSPSIVGIHEVGEIDGQHYFAMEYVPGPNLARLARNGPVDPRTAARLVMIVARAVAELHAMGIVHRDLKPANVLLDEAGDPRVTDFGLAKMLTPGRTETHSGTILGTPNYMAPEQAAGRAAEVGPLSDLYSLGAILYELLTGRPPFGGETPLNTLVQVLEGEPPRPRQLAKVPPALELICLKCLEKDPADRYDSADALADDLHRYLAGELVEARRTGPWHGARRWIRREPALVSRLGTMAICGAILQANRYLVGSRDPWHNRAIVVVVAWALVSVLIQQLLRLGGRLADPLRYAWAAADVALFTVLVQISAGLNTSLVAGYFLLVCASGLWFRERMVWVTTALAVVAYGVLVLIAASRDDLGISPYRHVIFAAVLAVSGVIIGYQVHRVRALSHYYQARPLP